MALATTNISTTLVRNELSEDNNNVFSLCTSSLINKWSRYKPVRDAGTGPNRPFGNETQRCGFDLYNETAPSWEYLHPRGGSPGGEIDEPGRLGDFRGYKHGALPPFELIGHPSATQLNNDSFGFALDVNEDDITVEDLLLDDWYFGVLVDSTFYSAAHPLGDRGTEIEAVSIQTGVLSAGSHDWAAYITQFPTSAGETPDTIIPLPEYTGYHISGTCEITLEPPEVELVNNSSIVPTRGNITCLSGVTYVTFIALNRGLAQAVEFFNDDAEGASVGWFVITEGDSETGLPETTGILTVPKPEGYGSVLHLRVEDSV
jgi:hypothetical protein